MLRIALCVFSPETLSFPSSSVWTAEDPLGSRHRPGAPTRRRQQTKWQAPPPLGSSQGPLGPVCLFYSPVLTRVFNFSFTSSVALTFNNTTKICSWQSWFRPQNHSGRRSWLTLSALQAVWSPSALSRSLGGVAGRPEVTDRDGMGRVPLPPSLEALQASGRKMVSDSDSFGDEDGFRRRGGGADCGLRGILVCLPHFPLFPSFHRPTAC